MSNQITETENTLLPKLSERLLRAAQLVMPGRKLADVGCDHGYLSIYLYKTSICPKCIAMDVNPGPLAAARENIRRYGADAGVETRLSDGLAALQPGECGCILLAGMGGDLIVRILQAKKTVLDEVSELVLEPQSEPFKVRTFLQENGFAVTREDMTRERGKYYPLIRAERAKEPEKLSDAQLMYGPCLIREKNPVLKDFLLQEKNRLTKILEVLTGRGALEESGRREQLEKELSQIRKIEELWNR